jgi:hypothetical protein
VLSGCRWLSCFTTELLECLTFLERNVFWVLSRNRKPCRVFLVSRRVTTIPGVGKANSPVMFHGALTRCRQSTRSRHLRGITIGNWAAAYATSYMAGILIQVGNTLLKNCHSAGGACSTQGFQDTLPTFWNQTASMLGRDLQSSCDDMQWYRCRMYYCRSQWVLPLRIPVVPSPRQGWSFEKMKWL